MMDSPLLFLLLVILPSCLAAPGATSGCQDKDGELIEEGSWFFPFFEAPCKSCMCDGGSPNLELCNDAVCGVPNCPGEPVEGVCCGWKCYEFKTCQDMNGTEVKNGDVYNPSKHDACMYCRCNDGEPVDCATAGCIRPPCKNWLRIEGVCCGFECIGETKPSEPEKLKMRGCIDRTGKSVKHEEVFQPSKDPCEECVCRNGKPDSCSMVMCDQPPCDDYELIEGTCCGFICKDEEDSSKSVEEESKEKRLFDLNEVFPED